jgi:anti-sigma factor RsiW
MTTSEAKFILHARRPNGGDDADPSIVEALAKARQDPELAAWLAKEHAFDTLIATKLSELPPPAGLREAILPGARARRPQPIWRRPYALGLAASVALIFGGLASWSYLRPTVDFERLALGVMEEVNSAVHHETAPMARGALRTALTDPALRLAAGLKLEFADLQRDGCRSLRIANRDVLEVCFERGGEFLHLYVARRDDFDGKKAVTAPVFREQGALASVAWTDARHAYVLVSTEGAASLRSIF